MRGVDMGLAALVAGCGVLPPPGHPVPAGREVREVVAVAARVEWALMELCVGQREPIDRWRWYIVRGGTWVIPDGREVAGLAQPPWRRIYLAEGQETDRGLVRHEILHALGVRDGSPVLVACGARP